MTAAGLGFHHRFVPGTAAVTLVLLHGTGGNEDDLLALGREVAPGAALLSPRGQVLEHGLPRFFRRLAEGVFDQEDLARRTDELAEFLDNAGRHYALAEQPAIALGYSNGANIASSLLFRRPGVLAGAGLLRPMVPFVPASTPGLDRVPVLIAAGRHDPIATPDLTAQLQTILEGAGARVTRHEHPGGHELGLDDLAAVKRWLRPLL